MLKRARADGKQAETDGQSDKVLEWEKRWGEEEIPRAVRPTQQRINWQIHAKLTAELQTQGFLNKARASEQPLAAAGWHCTTSAQLGFNMGVGNEHCESVYEWGRWGHCLLSELVKALKVKRWVSICLKHIHTRVYTALSFSQLLWWVEQPASREYRNTRPEVRWDGRKDNKRLVGWDRK